MCILCICSSTRSHLFHVKIMRPKKKKKLIKGEECGGISLILHTPKQSFFISLYLQYLQVTFFLLMKIWIIKIMFILPVKHYCFNSLKQPWERGIIFLYQDLFASCFFFFFFSLSLLCHFCVPFFIALFLINYKENFFFQGIYERTHQNLPRLYHKQKFNPKKRGRESQGTTLLKAQ